MQIDFGLRCNYIPRQHGDYAPPMRGCATVDDGDGHGYRYQVRRGKLRAFRAFLREHFCNLDEYRLEGRYPHYSRGARR